MRFKRIGSLALGLAVSALFVVLILRRVDLADVLAQAAEASPWLLAASLLTKLGGIVCQSFRARLLLAPLERFPLRRTFRAQLLALAGNNLLPLRAGELLRIDFLARKGRLPRASCLAVALCERLLDFFWLMALFVGIVPLIALAGPDLSRLGTGRLAWLVAALLAGLATLALLGRNPGPAVRLARRIGARIGGRPAHWLEAKLADFLTGLGVLDAPRRMLGAIAWTLAYWGFSMGSIALWLRAFALDLPPSAPLVILGFMAFGTALPSSPSFVGTYHYFTLQALELYRVEPTVAASFAVVGHAVAVVPFTLLATLVLAGELRAGVAALGTSGGAAHSRTSSETAGREGEPATADAPEL